MRLVYLDESGLGNPEVEPYTVVAGVIVHGDIALTSVKHRIREVVQKYIPADCRDDFVFHAKEIFNGGGIVFDRKSPRVNDVRKWAFADEIAAIPSEFNLPVTVTWVARASLGSTLNAPKPLSRHESTVLAHAACMISNAMQVEGWMRANAPDENCLIVAENNDHVREIVKRVQRWNQRPAELQEIEPKAANYLPLTRIHEDPLFQEKRPSNPMELADFIAFAWNRYLRTQDDDVFRRYVKPWLHLAVEPPLRS